MTNIAVFSCALNNSLVATSSYNNLILETGFYFK